MPVSIFRHIASMLLSTIMFLFLSLSAINDCLTSAADCVSIANCIDTADKLGFFCQCPPGYTGDGRKSGSGCAGGTLTNK